MHLEKNKKSYEKPVTDSPDDKDCEASDYKVLTEAGIHHPPTRRSELPSSRDKYHFSLIGFLRTTIGRDLTKVPMPVYFNEPLSFLQRLTEDLEYADLLNKAADCECTVDRIAYIAAFAASCYANVPGRFWKPFNPLLGETFEYHNKENSYSVIAEQVSHHPPVSAIHAESDKWVFWQEYKLDTKFRGMYVKVCPTGMVNLKFKGDNTHYSWKKPTTTIHNIVFGTLWVDHDGVIEITSNQTKDTATVNFRPYRKVKEYLKLTGHVMDKNGDLQYQFDGDWMSHLYAKPAEGSSRSELQMWNSIPKPEYAPKMFGLTSFAMQLNEIIEGIDCPTDSRRRPDQRLLEEGKVDKAGEEKYRLEEKQRHARKKREHNKTVWNPKWFVSKRDSDTEDISHVYKGGYWTSKLNNDYSSCSDIF